MKSILLVFTSFLLISCSSTYKPLDTRPLISTWTDGSDKGVPRAIEFAKEVLPYAVLSYEVYNKDENLYEQIPFPKNEVWTEILIGQGIENDIGFAAKAWHRKSNSVSEVIVAFRGTDSFLNDFFRGNLLFFKPYIYRTHFDAADDFVEKVYDYMAENQLTNVVFTGHSLGGGLAEYSLNRYEGSKAVTFDSSFNTGRMYSLFDDYYSNKVIRVYEKGEVLEWPRKLFLWDFEYDDKPWKNEVNTAYFQFYDSNPLSAHDMQDLAYSIVKAADLGGDLRAKSIVNSVINGVSSND